MCSVKRVELIAMLLVAMAAIGGMPAPARGADGTNLTCAVDLMDQDYGALGLVNFRDVHRGVDRDYNTWYIATVIILCSDLTPRAEYEVWCLDWYSDVWGLLGSFHADKNGRGSTQGLFGWTNALFVEVRRIDQTTLEPVSIVVLNGWPSPSWNR